jgi:hypothetical protein
MPNYSPQIKKFLEQVGADPSLEVSIVPRSDSCAKPGEVVFFRYTLGIGRGSRRERLMLITEPVTRDAATGNLLLTGFKIPDEGDYTPDSLENLYKNRELPEDHYRTYIMSRIYGHLRKISKLPSEEDKKNQIK